MKDSERVAFGRLMGSCESGKSAKVGIRVMTMRMSCILLSALAVCDWRRFLHILFFFFVSLYPIYFLFVDDTPRPFFIEYQSRNIPDLVSYPENLSSETAIVMTNEQALLMQPAANDHRMYRTLPRLSPA